MTAGLQPHPPMSDEHHTLAAPDPRFLVASTVALPGAGPDPLAMAMATADGFVLLGRRGSVATAGVAARLQLPGGLRPDTSGAVARWLAAVPAIGPASQPGSGPLAVGALPFLPGQPTELLLPVVSVVSTAAGRSWMTVVRPATTGAGRAEDPTSPADLAALLVAIGVSEGSDATVAVQTPRKAPADAAWAATATVDAIWQAPDGPEFERRVTAALAAIAAGRIGKVVLARQVHARFTHTLDPVSVLRRLQEDEPTCAVFAHRQAGRVFLGASPELLVRRRDDRVVSHPLAGTSAADDAAVAALVASGKEQAEHRTVAEAVADRLAAWCDELQVPEAPTPVRLHGVAHLGTRITGRLHQPAADALTLAAALHPTPAVAGVPTGAALALITDLEDEGRGFYAGPVGWVDARGDGEMLVAIRSATVAGNRAVAYGGAGIVAGSAPDRELAETAAKLHTALGALGIDAPAPSPV